MYKSLITCAATLFAATLCFAEITTFKYPAGIERSDLFTVSVGGKAQTVLATNEPDFCIFECDSPVTVTVKWNKKTTDAVIRPLSVDFNPKFKNGVLSFTMKPKDRAVVEFDGDVKKPLFIFANQTDSNKPKKGGQGVHYFAAGKIHNIEDYCLKDGETMYIEGGAVVRGNIRTDKSKNITIAGSGILDACYNSHKALRITKSENISINGITVLNKTGWTTYIAECSNVNIDNYKVIATFNPNHDRGLENDGLNLVSTTNAKVSHCLTYCHDDAYCVKTGVFKTVGKASDISFEDCIAWNVRGGNSVEIGYCTLYDIEDISFKDIYSIHKRYNDRGTRNADIAIHCASQGTVRNISYENIYLEESDNYTVHFSIFDNKNSMKVFGVEYKPGKIENITLKNIKVLYGDPKRSRIIGFDENNLIQNVRIEDFFIQGRKISDLKEAGFETENCKSITIQ